MRAELVIRCPKHPSYTGLGSPERDCTGCRVVSKMRGASFHTHAFIGDDSLPIKPLVRWGAA